MRKDFITGIEFFTLLNKSDRRGNIIKIFVKDVPNKNYVLNRAAEFVCSITTLLSDMYNGLWSFEPHTVELNDCWIKVNADNVVVIHKYWSQKQIDCFCEIFTTLAKFHNWEIKGSGNEQI